MDRTVRLILTFAAVLVAIIVIALVIQRGVSTDSIAYGEKCVRGTCWGYRVEKAIMAKRTTLSFWGPGGLQLRYDLPEGDITRTNEDRWLDKDRAIYLNLRVKQTSDPQELGAHIRVVYDYQRGELHLASPLPLWRVDDYHGRNPARAWLTDHDFDLLLITLDPTA